MGSICTVRVPMRPTACSSWPRRWPRRCSVWPTTWTPAPSWSWGRPVASWRSWRPCRTARTAAMSAWIPSPRAWRLRAVWRRSATWTASAGSWATHSRPKAGCRHWRASGGGGVFSFPFLNFFRMGRGGGGEGGVLYFSCHFHEFLSHGQARVEQALQVLTAQPQTAGILALEQPRLESEQRADTTPTRWLYAQSNVLIHHLIKNARILTGAQWQELLRRGGCSAVRVEPTRGFGFSAYVDAVAPTVGASRV